MLCASSTVSSAYNRRHTLSSPIFTPHSGALDLLIHASMKTLNSQGDITHPCLTPSSIVNHSDTLPSTRTHALLFSYIALTPSSNLQLILPRFLMISDALYCSFFYENLVKSIEINELGIVNTVGNSN